ncbi:MAG: M2 family metallopeptidase [Candidatus Diapherotrites archaeon]
MINKEIMDFLEEQTNRIKPLHKDLTHSYWDATTTGKKESYERYGLCQKELAKFFNNRANFEKIKQFLSINIDDKLIERQLRLLYNSYLGNQGDLNLINKILEKFTAIEEKFNKFRAKINGKEFTDNQIKEILKNETDSVILQEAWEASKMQGEFVANDLIELIKLRNQLAQSLGFKNYYVLSLEANEQTENEILEIFSKLDKSTNLIFSEVKKEIDDILSKRYKTSELNPWHYQDLFFQEAPHIYNIDLDDFYKEDIIEKAEKFYSSIGLDVLDIIERSDLYEKPGKYQHAYCMDLDREGDVRSLMNIKNNEKWMDTVLHELGHGIYWKYIDKDLPFLIRDTSHTLTTEAIALLMGRNAKNVSFIKEFCDVKAEEIDKIGESVRKSLKLRQLIFSRWSQVMVNFERNLYDNPDQNLNRLWWSLVKKYQLLDFSRDKADWASKIHFVSSPVYYHNYLLGELFASQINNYMAKSILKNKTSKNLDYPGNKEIGEYLKSKIFFPGALYKWNDLIKHSTGEELNPGYWVNDFC